MNSADQDRQPTIYGDVIPWERPVQLAAAFFVRTGDTVLDVGGNTGGVAIAFARMVGPRGMVYSFECNPKMIEWMRMDCAANNIRNVEIVPLAAYKESGRDLTFYLDESFYSAASSLHRIDLKEKIVVRTTTIDEMCACKKISPSLIKIDIEGGEADAIAGAIKTIDRQRPVVILEFNPFADNPLTVMQGFGYDIYDVNTYGLVDNDYFEGKCSTNVVCVPRELRLQFRLGSVSSVRSGIVPVDAGFAVISFDLAYYGNGVGELNCIGPDGKLIAYFQTEFSHLAHHSCSSIPLFTDVKGEVFCSVSRVSGDGAICIAGATVRKLELAESDE